MIVWNKIYIFHNINVLQCAIGWFRTTAASYLDMTDQNKPITSHDQAAALKSVKTLLVARGSGLVASVVKVRLL